MDLDKADLVLKQMCDLNIIDLNRDSFALRKPARSNLQKGYELHIKVQLDLANKTRIKQITAAYKLKIKESSEKVVICDQ